MGTFESGSTILQLGSLSFAAQQEVAQAVASAQASAATANLFATGKADFGSVADPASMSHLRVAFSFWALARNSAPAEHLWKSS
jgi:hypothetical protein